MPPITDPVVIDLVRRVQARLTPENYDQTVFCGSACCLAGHLRAVAAVHHPDPQVRAYANRLNNNSAGTNELAADLLGLQVDAGLFSAYPAVRWPPSFAREWGESDDGLLDDVLARRVDIARRRLDYFLETGE
jgi:hypothetical protein